ncbi:MAG: hypothetical protein QOG58_3400, partial [Caballeronia sp.]|nr:hypothetical protein [Caballeronia sp.]
QVWPRQVSLVVSPLRCALPVCSPWSLPLSYGGWLAEVSALKRNRSGRDEDGVPGARPLVAIQLPVDNP